MCSSLINTFNRKYKLKLLIILYKFIKKQLIFLFIILYIYIMNESIIKHKLKSIYHNYQNNK